MIHGTTCTCATPDRTILPSFDQLHVAFARPEVSDTERPLDVRADGRADEARRVARHTEFFEVLFRGARENAARPSLLFERLSRDPVREARVPVLQHADPVAQEPRGFDLVELVDGLLTRVAAQLAAPITLLVLLRAVVHAHWGDRLPDPVDNIQVVGSAREPVFARERLQTSAAIKRGAKRVPPCGDSQSASTNALRKRDGSDSASRKENSSFSMKTPTLFSPNQISA